jgi:D-sedoheptulose 7-phosphate isomerase
MQSEGSEYERLFYPYLFAGGRASAEEVLAQVRHSTLEKCQETIALRRATLAQSGEQIIAAAKAMVRTQPTSSPSLLTASSHRAHQR